MSEMSEENVKSSTTGGSAYGVTPFCSTLDGGLSAKKCGTCYSKDLGPMTEESAQPLLRQIPGWNLVNDNGTLKLQRSWITKSFKKGLDFFKIVGDVAESEGHHPDLHLVGWNNVSIEIWTHAIDLSAKKCGTCYTKHLGPMTEESAQPLLQQIPGWNLVNDNGTLKLQRSWITKSFKKGIDFFKIVGDVAESEGHHPDLHLVGWNNVSIEIWTHAIGGLTENDFIFAAKINALHVEDLMRIKKDTSEITWSSAP